MKEHAGEQTERLINHSGYLSVVVLYLLVDNSVCTLRRYPPLGGVHIQAQVLFKNGTMKGYGKNLLLMIAVMDPLFTVSRECCDASLDNLVVRPDE